jgi:hypothetical protein
MKSIVFAGSSYTWGEGLQYYSDLENINPYATQFNRWELNDEHIKFIEQNRFSRLVSNYFNTKDIVRKDNGGTNDDIINFVETKLDLAGCEYIIFQFTNPFRDLVNFSYAGKEFNINLKNKDEIQMIEFQNYIRENWNYNFDNFVSYFINSKIKKIKDTIYNVEAKGIKKCFILCQTNDMINHFKIDSYLNDRLIRIKINGTEFATIDDAIFGKRGFFGLKRNTKLEIIENDISLFKKYNTIIRNKHLTFESHKIIAKNIIELLNNHE